MEVKFIDVQLLYRATANTPGLVHAVVGPSLDNDRYNVSLAPLGREGQYERVDTEEAVQRSGASTLHAVFWMRRSRYTNFACRHSKSDSHNCQMSID